MGGALCAPSLLGIIGQSISSELISTTKAKSLFWETYAASGINMTQALSAPWCGKPPWCGDSIAVQIKQMWYM